MATNQLSAPHTEQTKVLAALTEPTIEIPTDQPAKQTAPSRSGNKVATDFLFLSDSITPVGTEPLKKTIVQPIHYQDLFDSLLSLYEAWFKSNWRHFKPTAEMHVLEGGYRDHCSAVARAYVSQWFYDLYATLYKCAAKVDTNVQRSYFYYEWFPSTISYDHFLSRLNATIRPTHIKLTSLDAIHFPVFSKRPTVSNSNFLRIAGFCLQDNLLTAINQIMISKSLCRITPLSEDKLGSPSWLYDIHVVHQRTRAYAWFQKEGNYTDEDTALALIIGVPCTPHLGQADVDEWQFFIEGQDPLYPVEPHHLTYKGRRRFSGTAEVRTMDKQTVILPNFYDRTANFLATNKGPLAISISPHQLAPVIPETETQAIESLDRPITPGAIVIREPPSSAHTRPATETPPPKKKSKTTRPKLVRGTRYRLVTYVYPAVAASRIDKASRYGAHSLFLQD